MRQKTAIIIGAGPAGLTVAWELIQKTDIKPIIIEKLDIPGGIARTVNHNGNRIDIGGHRFFSKNDSIMKWWLSFLPLQGSPSLDEIKLKKEPVSLSSGGPNPEITDEVMLYRRRLSRILYQRKLYPYPISLSLEVLNKLGIYTAIKIGVSYIISRLLQRKPELSLEDFMVNRFGYKLFDMFFRGYTHKVWGVWPKDLPRDWGAQRIKKLSLGKAILHFFTNLIAKPSQKAVETSLIESFYYPKLGPGQLWSVVADRIVAKGGEIHYSSTVLGLQNRNNSVTQVVVEDKLAKKTMDLEADYVISTMPIKDLIEALNQQPSAKVKSIAKGLGYRDFITVGLLLKSANGLSSVQQKYEDLWIYVQDNDVEMGRIQFFNNWSPYLVSDPEKMWVGLEYFCDEGDAFWLKPDNELISQGVRELERVGIIDKPELADAVVLRQQKAYPAYLGTYKEFDVLKNYIDQYDNLFLIGRNGMHRYNNMDHSMLTAFEAVECIRNAKADKSSIWNINTEESYHETKT